MDAEKRDAAEPRQTARAELDEYLEVLRAMAGPVRAPVSALAPELFEALFPGPEAERAAAPLVGALSPP